MDLLNENFETAQGRLWRFHVYPKNSKHVSTGYVLFIFCDCFINGLPHQICWDVFVSSLLDTSGMIYSISRDETWLSFAHVFFFSGGWALGPLVSEGPTWRSRVFRRIEVPIWHTSGTSIYLWFSGQIFFGSAIARSVAEPHWPRYHLVLCPVSYDRIFYTYCPHLMIDMIVNSVNSS